MSNEFSSRVFWSCPKDEPLGRISRALGVPEAFCVEISAHGWENLERVMDELARAFSFADGFGRSWSAVSDGLSGFRETRPRFAAVIRDIPESEAGWENVARAAEMIGPEFPDSPEHSVVLDGWDRPSIEVRWPVEKCVVPVRPLKTS